MRRFRIVAALAGLAVGLSCRTPASFTCASSAECGADGTCEPSGYCSFPDSVCPSQRRYGEHAAAELAGTCVPEPSGTGDGTTSTKGSSDGEGDETVSGGSTSSTTLDSTTRSTTGPSTGGLCPPASQCEVDADCPGDSICIECLCFESGNDTTGGNSQACEDCQAEAQARGGACYDEVLVCSENPECAALVDCVSANMCVDDACYEMCFSKHPDGYDDFQAIAVCLLGMNGMGGACGDVCS